MQQSALIVRHLGTRPYLDVWQAMQAFTDQRDASTPDEIWLLEHDAVFTQGQAGKAEHLLKSTTIPVVQSDRGGQITYHGPGQLIAYLLLDVRRNGITVRELVTVLEQAVIARPSFALVGYQNHRNLALLAQVAADFLIERG